MKLTLEILTELQLTPKQIGKALKQVSEEVRDGSASGTIKLQHKHPVLNGRSIGMYVVNSGATQSTMHRHKPLRSTDPMDILNHATDNLRGEAALEHIEDMVGEDMRHA